MEAPMSLNPQTETERLVQALLSDAAAGARATVDTLRDQVAQVTAAQRDVLLSRLREAAPQPQMGYGQ
jgi:hypothetical protein